ncbi:MAG TPA: hypothetical protein VIY73_09975, partial [Polyangiaceae bacterium]
MASCVRSKDAAPATPSAEAALAQGDESLVSAARDRAARDLGCPEITLDAAWSGGVLRATGCGRHALYIVASRGGVEVLPLSSAPQDAGTGAGS